MSNLTQTILKSIDYDKIKLIINKNFLFLHSHLKKINELKIDVNSLNGPMVYPLLLKKDRIKQKIYVATYWPNVLDQVYKNSIEYNITEYLLPFPIDQRYNLQDMERIVKSLKSK